jgi:hypothetical protein
VREIKMRKIMRKKCKRKRKGKKEIKNESEGHYGYFTLLSM